MNHPKPQNLYGLFELPYDGPIWEWAENNIIIPDAIPSRFKGPYRSDIAPYTRLLLDLFQDQKINKYVIMKGAQTMITTAVYIWLMARCRLNPGPGLVVYSTEDIARSMSETIFMPIFEASPGLVPIICKTKTKWTKLQQQLLTCVLNWVGSNSPAQIASRGRQIVIMDEVDKWPSQSKDEADPVNLVEQRTKTFGDTKKIIMLSSPTTSRGHVYSHYKMTDKRRFQVPCPHCGMMQVLVWSQVKFDSKLSIDSAALNAFYECAGCKGKINDAAKNDIINKCVLEPTVIGSDPTTIGIHIPSLYSPLVTWAYLVRKFLTTQADPKQLQDFVNSELGEPFDKSDAKINDDSLFAREGAFEEGQLWLKVPPYDEAFKNAVEDEDYAVMSWTDVQQNYLVTVVRVFARNGDSGLLWSGELSGFDAHDELVKKFKPLYSGFDKKYRKDEVHAWVYDHRANGYLVTSGSPRKLSTLYDAHALNIDEGKKTSRPHGGKARNILELTIDTNTAKDYLEMCVSGHKSAPRWMIPAGYSQNRNYAQQLTAMHRIAGKWEKIGQRADHAHDAESNLIVMAIKLGFWEWRNKTDDDKEGADEANS